jgi:hypothetical protein
MGKMPMPRRGGEAARTDWPCDFENNITAKDVKRVKRYSVLYIASEVFVCTVQSAASSSRLPMFDFAIVAGWGLPS